MGVDHEPLPSRLASRSSSDGDPVPKLSSYACARVSGDGLMVTGPSEVSGIGGIGMRGSPSSGSGVRSEEHTSELQSLMRISYAVFCLKKKKNKNYNTTTSHPATHNQ